MIVFEWCYFYFQKSIVVYHRFWRPRDARAIIDELGMVYTQA